MRPVDTLPDASGSMLFALVDWAYRPGERLQVIERYGSRWCSTVTGAFIDDRLPKAPRITGWLCTVEEMASIFPKQEDDPSWCDAAQIVAYVEDCIAPVILKRVAPGWVDALGRPQSVVSWHCSLGALIAKFDLNLDLRT